MTRKSLRQYLLLAHDLQSLKPPLPAGLCPGLNDVVQGIVRKLEDYGVPEGNILGIK